MLIRMLLNWKGFSMLLDKMSSFRMMLGASLLVLMNLTSLTVAQEKNSPSYCYVDGLSDRLPCGFIQVAEDSSKPQGRKIDIHYVVIPAVKPVHPTEALLAIAGGPGQSAIDNAALFNNTFKKVRETRDILLIDQRGTGRSNILQCPQDNILSPLMVDEQGFDVIVETEKCLSNIESDLAMYDSSTAIHDFEAVRKFLGYEKLHVYGISYGSRMAQLYMRHYSEALLTVTLDGVVPMQQSVLAVGLSVDRALEGVLEQCAADAACNQQFPALRSDLSSLTNNLTNNPVTTNVFHPMTGNPETFLLTRDKLLGILRLSMYSPSTRTLLPLAINLAASGNYQPLLGLYSLIMNGIDLAAGMHNSVVCAEDVHRVSPDLMADIEQSYTANSLYEAMVKSCSIWPSNRVDEKFFNPIESDIPTLLLSGELDPATPPDWGALAMVNMTNAAHFVAPYATHGVAAQTCGSDLVADLVDLGTVTDLDASCLSETHFKNFYLNPSSAQALQSKTTVEDSP